MINKLHQLDGEAVEIIMQVVEALEKYRVK
jgi:hypothetical protein